jgi:glycosyltransferase involved in cell wall biosynthesis
MGTTAHRVARERVLEVLQPPIGGVPTYVAMLARGLAARGWEVLVAGPTDASALHALADSRVESVHLPLERSPNPRSDAAAIARLVRLARSRRIDLIHGHSSKANVLTALAARASGVPSVYTPHAWAFEMRQPMAIRAALAGVEAALNLMHERIIAVCRAEAAIARRWGVARAKQLRVVHTGLPACEASVPRDLAREQLGVDPERVVVAWVGRRGPGKRPEELAAIASRLPEDTLVVALGQGLADDPLLAGVLNEAGVRVLAARVEPGVLLAAADVFVLTSDWEAFPLAVLEAMRAGLPVVAHAVGGVVEQVENGVTGHLVAREDARGLAERTRTLVADPAERRRMGAAAAARFRQRFTLERMLDGIEHVYQEVLRPGPPRAPCTKTPSQKPPAGRGGYAPATRRPSAS